MTKKSSTKKVAGVALEPEVIGYLDSLAEKEERSRSWILNRLAKEHAEQNGVSLDLFVIQEAQAQG